MKRLLALSILLVHWLNGEAQLLVSMQLPETGLIQKPELWNMALTNTTLSTFRFRVELNIADAASGVAVLRASTPVLDLTPGTSFFNASRFGAIRYAAMGSTPGDVQSGALLPVGRFTVCFSFFQMNGDLSSKLSDECQQIVVEPLSPPELVAPENNDTILDARPVFSWLPPQPLNMIGALTYQVGLVEQRPGQSEADALQKNIPLWVQSGITNTTMLYGGAALQNGKRYLWRVTALSSGSAVSTSAYSRFIIGPDSLRAQRSSGVYVRLRKEVPATCAAHAGWLRFAYLNEAGDSAWNVRFFDLSVTQRKQVPVPMDGIPLTAGENLVDLPLFAMGDFTNGHVYIIEVTDSRQQLWQLQFQFFK